MSTSESHRISGVLVAWRLSKGGGFGRVIANEQSYFICRRFIVEGLPIVGSPLTFEIAPPLPGKLFPQAINVKINNRQIVRAMNMPKMIKDGNGAADFSLRGQNFNRVRPSELKASSRINVYRSYSEEQPHTMYIVVPPEDAPHIKYIEAYDRDKNNFGTGRPV